MSDEPLITYGMISADSDDESSTQPMETTTTTTTTTSKRRRLPSAPTGPQQKKKKTTTSTTTTPTPTTMELSAGAQHAAEEHAKLVAQVDKLATVRAMVISTNDEHVRVRLRNLGHPITLFGEGPGERRDRLREVLTALEMEGVDTAGLGMEGIVSDDENELAEEAFAEAELVYTQGSAELLESRVAIREYSLAAAEKRRAEESEERRGEGGVARLAADIRVAVNALGEYVGVASQRGGRRVLAYAAYAETGNHVATVSWDGSLKVWDVPSCQEVAGVEEAHLPRASAVEWAVGGGGALGSSQLALGSCGADHVVRLWDGGLGEIGTLSKHADRISRIAFHPMGRHLASASFDCTWRLHDLETQTELLLQDGHSRPVYGLGIHPDGSLLGSAGLDALARVWDLRNGRSIMTFEGHVHGILALDFSSNGYHMATGGDDNMIYLWDLRKQHAVYIIPAHTKLVSSLKFLPHAPSSLLSAGYDGSIRLWDGNDFSLAKSWDGHSDKVSSLSIAPSGSSFVSSSFDRTFKVWAKE